MKTSYEFLSGLDLLNWFRYAAIIKKLTKLKPKSVLEAGPGEGVIKSIMSRYVERYDTLDVNSKLEPTYLSDVRGRIPKATGKYDVVIAADILEHIPFVDVPTALRNLREYLMPGGVALITIPHRAWFVFWMDWISGQGHTFRFPDWIRTFYHHRLHRRKNPIDTDHSWEIGDGLHKVQDIENIMRDAGFLIKERQELPYVDFWVLGDYQ